MSGLLEKEPYWNIDEGGNYHVMDYETFMIFRHPSSKRMRKAHKRYRRVYEQELDKRWNWWHHWFKRKLVYGSLELVLKMMKILRK